MGSTATIIGKVMIEEDGTMYIINGNRVLWCYLKSKELFEIANELLHVFAKRLFEKHVRYVREIGRLEDDIKQMENTTDYWEPSFYNNEEEALQKIEKQIEEYVNALERKYRMLEEKEEKYEKLKEVMKELADIRIKLIEVCSKGIEFLVMD